MSEVVYVLCAATSLVCALLLYRGFRASRHRLLFWTGLCFAGLALHNLLMVVDYLVFPSVDLVLVRHATAHASMWTLVFGLVWTSRSEA